MSIARLEKVVVAAGYAMVPEDDSPFEHGTVLNGSSAEPREAIAWRSVQTKLAPAATTSGGVLSWLRTALNGFGGGATA
jgi:hypothetical protein